MSHRHDDELPALTPDQQAETIRLAARLQAEHEARSSAQALLQAASEAGIEERFVREAAARVAGRTVRRAQGWRVDPGALALTILVAAALLAGMLYAPPAAIMVALGFVFALFPTLRGRSRPQTYALVLLSWALFDAAFAVSGLDVHGEFLLVGVLQILGTVVGVELARLASRTQAHLDAPHPDAPHRPQSL